MWHWLWYRLWDSQYEIGPGDCGIVECKTMTPCTHYRKVLNQLSRHGIVVSEWVAIGRAQDTDFIQHGKVLIRDLMSYCIID